MDGIFLSPVKYASLLVEESFCFNVRDDLTEIRFHVANPTAFEKLCRDAGAENLYNCTYDTICSDQIATDRKHLGKLRTMAVIYIIIYSQYRRCDVFQVALSITFQ